MHSQLAPCVGAGTIRFCVRVCLYSQQQRNGLGIYCAPWCAVVALRSRIETCVCMCRKSKTSTLVGGVPVRIFVVVHMCSQHITNCMVVLQCGAGDGGVWKRHTHTRTHIGLDAHGAFSMRLCLGLLYEHIVLAAAA